MPIYEYKCESCGHELETIQQFSDDPLRTCPECQEERLIKKMSYTAPPKGKGEGWHANDYPKRGPR